MFYKNRSIGKKNVKTYSILILKLIILFTQAENLLWIQVIIWNHAALIKLARCFSVLDSRRSHLNCSVKVGSLQLSDSHRCLDPVHSRREHGHFFWKKIILNLTLNLRFSLSQKRAEKPTKNMLMCLKIKLIIELYSNFGAYFEYRCHEIKMSRQDLLRSQYLILYFTPQISAAYVE